MVVAIGSLAACGGDDDGAFSTLPPIRTTTTSSTTTTVVSTEPQYYVVQRGDVLSIIAELFDVPMQAIMDANGISDPNAIQAGQTLRIPTGVVVVNTLPPRSATTLAGDPGTPEDPGGGEGEGEGDPEIVEEGEREGG